MKVELTPDVAAGTFPTPEDAVRRAVTELRANAMRATLDAAVAEGGSHTTADARRFVREQLEKRNERVAAQ